jgi:transposase
LLAKGYAVAVLNPLRTRRFAEQELQRTKTDAIDALGIARFAAQKRPPAAQLPDSATEELRELARLRERLAEDFASRLRQLHRAVDLGFPEFTRYVRTLESQLATTILSRYPTAASFHGASVKKLARIIYDGSHKVGEELARTLIEAAEKSVGSHHSEPYRLRIKYLCEDLDVLRRRVKDLARDIERKVDDHEVGKLLTTIDGVGPLTAACLIAELGDPARFRSAGAIARLRRRCPTAAAIGQEALPAVQQFRLETLACARRSGWWFSTPPAATRGCVSTMNAFGPRANPARSR